MIGLPQLERALAKARVKILTAPADTAMALALYDVGVDPGAAARVALAYAIECDAAETNGEASAFLMGMVTALEVSG